MNVDRPAFEAPAAKPGGWTIVRNAYQVEDLPLPALGYGEEHAPDVPALQTEQGPGWGYGTAVDLAAEAVATAYFVPDGQGGYRQVGEAEARKLMEGLPPTGITVDDARFAAELEAARRDLVALYGNGDPHGRPRGIMPPAPPTPTPPAGKTSGDEFGWNRKARRAARAASRRAARKAR